MAAGARPNFFGVPGAEEHAFPLYSVADAERLRLHLQDLLQAARSGAGDEPGLLDVVVVGGGPTGVETTGALAELMQALKSDGTLKHPGQITIVDRGPALLGPFSEKAHKYVAEKLTEVGATIRLKTGVSAVHEDRVDLDDGSSHPSSDRGLGRGRVGCGGRPDGRPSDRPRWPAGRAAGPDSRRIPRRLRGRRRRQHPRG